MRAAWTRLATVSIAAVAALTLAACDAIPEITALRDKAAAARDQISAEVEVLEQARAVLPADAPEAPAADAAIVEASARRANVAALVEDLDTLLAEAERPSDTLSGAAHALSPLLPEPFRGPLLLAAGLGVALWRAGQLKRSAVSIVAGFEEAMRRDEGLRGSVRQHADLFRAAQTPTARRIVDEVTKQDRAMLRLPV